jgi:hypothetical protein
VKPSFGSNGRPPFKSGRVYGDDGFVFSSHSILRSAHFDESTRPRSRIGTCLVCTWPRYRPTRHNNSLGFAELVLGLGLVGIAPGSGVICGTGSRPDLQTQAQLDLPGPIRPGSFSGPYFLLSLFLSCSLHCSEHFRGRK